MRPAPIVVTQAVTQSSLSDGALTRAKTEARGRGNCEAGLGSMQRQLDSPPFPISCHVQGESRGFLIMEIGFLNRRIVVLLTRQYLE